MRLFISLSEAPYDNNPMTTQERKDLTSLLLSWVHKEDREAATKVVSPSELLVGLSLSETISMLNKHGWKKFPGNPLDYRMRPFSNLFVNVSRMQSLALTRYAVPSPYKTLVALTDKLVPEKIEDWRIKFPALFHGAQK